MPGTANRTPIGSFVLLTMDTIGHYYEVLGLKRNASPDEVKEAYRDLARVWHPDRFPTDPRLRKKAEEKLKEINEAYEHLRSFRPATERRTGPRGQQPQQPDPRRDADNDRSASAAAPPGEAKARAAPGTVKRWLMTGLRTFGLGGILYGLFLFAVLGRSQSPALPDAIGGPIFFFCLFVGYHVQRWISGRFP